MEDKVYEKPLKTQYSWLGSGDLRSEGVQIYTLNPEQNGHPFADDIEYYFVNEDNIILSQMSLRLVTSGKNDDMSALV